MQIHPPKHIFSILATFCLTGCALNTHALKGQIVIPESEADRIIEQYQGNAGVGLGSYEMGLGEAYALKSVYTVQRRSPFNRGLVLGGIACEALCQLRRPGLWIEGLPYAVATPFAYLFDFITYPKSLVEHISVDDAEIERAIRYMTQARKNGYDEKIQGFIPYSASVSYIDE